jgi:hypothetical protein
MNRNVEINIEELVLHGFSPGDRYRIGEALELELVRLFTEQGVPGALSENRNVDRVNAGTFNASPNAKAESIGMLTAVSVYKGF